MTWFEFVCTMASTNSNCQTINTSFSNKLFNFFWTSVRCVFCTYINSIFNTSKSTKFCFNYNSSFVSIISNFFSKFDIFLKWMMRTINHNRCKSIVYTVFAQLKCIAVV